jgi:hypothetical protein
VRGRRYDKLANEVLAESTVASGDSTVQYLAACAALQQWEQAALAFLLLHMRGGDDGARQLSAEALSEGVESLLEDTFQVASCSACHVREPRLVLATHLHANFFCADDNCHACWGSPARCLGHMA